MTCLIPEEINPCEILAALNAAGWKDYKIEIALDLSVGYIAALKSAKVKNPRYNLAAKLYNFYVAQVVPRGTEKKQCHCIA